MSKAAQLNYGEYYEEFHADLGPRYKCSNLIMVRNWLLNFEIESDVVSVDTDNGAVRTVTIELIGKDEQLLANERAFTKGCDAGYFVV